MAFLQATAVTPAAKEENAPPKPTVFVSFDRPNIRENDAIPVEVWFANEWDQPLKSVNMQVAGPGFMKWYKEPCQSLKSDEDYKQAKIPDTGLALDGVNPNSVIHKTLCIKSDSDIIIGDFNVSVAFDYSWQRGDSFPHSLVTSEKTLKAGLLGSDSIVGVPLVLAGFIVPGLFFWLILTKFPLSKYEGFKWIPTDLPLGDQLIYSLITSFLIVWAGNSFRFENLSNSISMAKLFSYALQGLVFGLGAGLFLWSLGWGLEKWKKSRAEAKEKEIKESAEAKEKEIKESDELVVQLRKLLALYPNYQTPQTTIRLKDGRTLVGTLATETGGRVVLAGWFEIASDILAGSDDALNKFTEYYSAGKWSEALEVAGNESLRPRREVQELLRGKKVKAGENTAIFFIEKKKIEKNGIERKNDGEDKFLEFV